MVKKTIYIRDTNKPFDSSDIDYSIIDNMTDEEAHERATKDPDAQPLTEKQLKKLKHVTPKKKDDTQ